MPPLDAKYERTLQEFEALTRHACWLSSQTSGQPVDCWAVVEASHIFAKLCMHGLSISLLAPSGNRPVEIWDLSSICALARCLVDAYSAMHYVAVDPVDDRERTFRRRLWVFHSEERRLDMLRLVGSKDPRVTELAADVDRLREEVASDPFYATLDNQLQRRARKGDLALHLTNSEIAKRAGIQPKYYKAVYRYLSNYTHTHALSVSQLAAFRAGDPESLRLIGTALQYGAAYLSMAIRDFTKIASAAPALPAKLGVLISKWESIVGSPCVVGDETEPEP